MLKRWLDTVEYAGWGFLGVSFLVFAAPGVLLVWQFTYEGTELATRVGAGLVLAAVAAAIFTYVCNELLYRRALHREAARAAKGKSGRDTNGKHQK